MSRISKHLPILALCSFLAGCGGGEGGTGNVDLPNTVPALDNVTVVAWNDLGMHCVDGKDYSVFSILPPYNNLHAQIIQRNVSSSKVVTSGVTLTYQAVADATGSNQRLRGGGAVYRLGERHRGR